MGEEPSGTIAPIRWREVALVVAGYLLATWLYWEPFFSAPELHYSAGRDYFQNSWNLWWCRHAWELGLPFYRCEWLFHPAGTSLAFHTITFANTLPGLMLQDVLDLTQTHSVLFLSAFFFSAVGAWALARHLTGSGWGAFVAGLLFSFNPYHTAMITQLNNAQFQWAPLFLLALVLLYRRGRWWHLAWAGVLLALSGYADWYQPVLLALGGGVLLLVLMLRDRRLGDLRLWVRLAGAVALAAVVMLPGLLPLLRVRSEVGDQIGVGVRYAGEMGLLGVNPTGSPFVHAWPVYLGWTACGLLAWTAWKVRVRGMGPWWWLLGAAFVLLQGPYLVVLKRHLEWLPMPMALFPHLPVLDMIRVPHRFLLLLLVAMAVLLAFGMGAWLERTRRRDADGRPAGLWGRLPGGGHAVGAVFSALLLLELQPPRLEPVHLDYADVYDSLAVDPEDYAVLELPLDFRDGYTMFLQTLHGKRLLAGYTSHILPAAVEGLRTDLMRALLPANAEYDLEHLPRFRPVDLATLDEATLDAWRRELREDKGVQVILFHRESDLPDATLEVPEQPGPGRKLAIGLLPFRFNPMASELEQWRRRAVVAGHRRMVEGSTQARALMVRLFGEPKLQDRTEVWDLRPPRVGGGQANPPKPGGANSNQDPGPPGSGGR